MGLESGIRKNLSRIQGQKGHRVMNLDQQHCIIHPVNAPVVTIGQTAPARGLYLVGVNYSSRALAGATDDRRLLPVPPQEDTQEGPDFSQQDFQRSEVLPGSTL